LPDENSRQKPRASATLSDDVFRDVPPEVVAVYRRNFTANVLYSIFIRMGWIYKTESTVIPGFVTSLTSNPMLISVTPIISRISQFLPQFLFLNVVERAPRKKPMFLLVTTLFALSWGVLSATLWFGEELSASVLLTVFFLCYGTGWVCTGISVILDRVMLGRLIPTRRRGRVFAIAGPFGSYSVVLSGPVIAYLLSHAGDFPRNYAVVFGIGFVTFLAAIACATLIREPFEKRDAVEREGFVGLARHGWALVRTDASFRRIFGLACIQSLSAYLFSYYVAYARTWSPDMSFQTSLNASLGWGLSVQNVVIGTLSLFMGLLVDWKGNRVVLRALCAILTFVPVVATIIGRSVPLSHRLTVFLVVYAMIGCLPVLQRVMSNYVLEITTPERQALYVGIFGSGQMVTLLFPVCLGSVIETLRDGVGNQVAYEIAFVGCTLILSVSVVFAWRLIEPRHVERKPAVSDVGI
jgi:MFS family permease